MVIQVAIGAILDFDEARNARIYLQKRSEDGPLDGTYEMPGGKVEADETGEMALIRELKEEVEHDFSEESVKYFKTYVHEYTDRAVSLAVYLVKDGEALKKREGGRFVGLDIARGVLEEDLEIPGANHEILKEICGFLGKIKEWNDLWVTSLT